MQARDWHFPATCPICLAAEGVPVGIATKTALVIEVWVKCCRCAHEWRMKADFPELFLKPKPDRRNSVA